MMDVILAQPRGFCAGVRRAIESVERALNTFAPPVYVLHEIVHNRYVVEDLKKRGAVFVETLKTVPEGAVCIFSAHGGATTVVQQAQQRSLHIIDATCPLVTKVHSQAQRYAQQDFELIIIGHPGHPEVEGTKGCVAGSVQIVSDAKAVTSLIVNDPKHLAYVTQTTLSIDDTQTVIAALTARFPDIQGPALSDICYATQNRQNAVRKLAKQINVLLVVGAHNSSNSNRLREVGEQAGVWAYLVEDAQAIQLGWLSEDAKIGITAGASTPEILVKEVLQRLHTLGIHTVTTMHGELETTTFCIPDNLLTPNTVSRSSKEQ